ncbi:MAG: hypothetical protein GWO07_16105 [Candidatus Dadabacteria bacterium]|nr:hypothetical protein [Candidatus Dadabacteria bacterium]NIS10227.1 hypothetical protein [Candidatus Dadabacteria bacterium]NIV42672.1 hypothetical protein [Candidatus Dadabacteria bacterium]NIX16595.1 hypothetical protein [Candidatus Dadabacteria bacterium]NIY23142.1 hypothetical protein [Candidatus Dadabacteria bacterium]
MQEIIIPTVVISLLLSPFISFRYASGKYKNQNISKLKAYFYFLLISSLPMLAFIVLSLGMVGLEEITGRAIISDSFARSSVVVVGFGLLLLLNLSVIFIVYIRKIRRDR